MESAESIFGQGGQYALITYYAKELAGMPCGWGDRMLNRHQTSGPLRRSHQRTPRRRHTPVRASFVRWTWPLVYALANGP